MAMFQLLRKCCRFRIYRKLSGYSLVCWILVRLSFVSRKSCIHSISPFPSTHTHTHTHTHLIRFHSSFANCRNRIFESCHISRRKVECHIRKWREKVEFNRKTQIAYLDPWRYGWCYARCRPWIQRGPEWHHHGSLSTTIVSLQYPTCVMSSFPSSIA